MPNLRPYKDLAAVIENGGSVRIAGETVTKLSRLAELYEQEKNRETPLPRMVPGMTQFLQTSPPKGIPGVSGISGGAAMQAQGEDTADAEFARQLLGDLHPVVTVLAAKHGLPQDTTPQALLEHLDGLVSSGNQNTEPAPDHVPAAGTPAPEGTRTTGMVADGKGGWVYPSPEGAASSEPTPPVDDKPADDTASGAASSEPAATDLPLDFPKRQLLLDNGLTSVDAVRNASDSDLRAIDGIGDKALEAIREAAK